MPEPNIEQKYERLLTRLTVLSVESPPFDPPLNVRQGRGNCYYRGRQETWDFFARQIRELLKQNQDEDEGLMLLAGLKDLAAGRNRPLEEIRAELRAAELGKSDG